MLGSDIVKKFPVGTIIEMEKRYPPGTIIEMEIIPLFGVVTEDEKILILNFPDSDNWGYYAEDYFKCYWRVLA